MTNCRITSERFPPACCASWSNRDTVSESILTPTNSVFTTFFPILPPGEIKTPALNSHFTNQGRVHAYGLLCAEDNRAFSVCSPIPTSNCAAYCPAKHVFNSHINILAPNVKHFKSALYKNHPTFSRKPSLSPLPLSVTDSKNPAKMQGKHEKSSIFTFKVALYTEFLTLESENRNKKNRLPGSIALLCSNFLENIIDFMFAR